MSKLDDNYLKTAELSSILLPCIDSILLLFAFQYDKQLSIIKIIQNYFANHHNEDFVEYLNKELFSLESNFIIPESIVTQPEFADYGTIAELPQVGRVMSNEVSKFKSIDYNQTLFSEILTIKDLLTEFMAMNRNIIMSDVFKGFAEELNDKIHILVTKHDKVNKFIQDNVVPEQLYVDHLRKVFSQQEEVATLLDSIITQNTRHITIINNIYSLHKELLNNTQIVIENMLYNDILDNALEPIAYLRHINNINNKKIVTLLDKLVVLPPPVSNLLNWVINTQFMLNNLSLNKATIKSFLNLEKETLVSLRSIYPIGQNTKDYQLQNIILIQESIIKLLENNNHLFEQDKLIIYENHLNIKSTLDGLVNFSITRGFIISLQNKQQAIRSLLSIGYIQDIYELVQAVKYLSAPDEEKLKLLENFYQYMNDLNKQIIHTTSSIEYDNRINRVNNTEANNHILITNGILRDTTELELLNYEIINTLTYYNTDDYMARIKKLFHIARNYYPDTKSGILEISNVGYERITDLLNERIINLVANRKIKISDITYIHHTEVEKFSDLITELNGNHNYKILDLLVVIDCKQSIEIYKSIHPINSEQITQIEIIQSIVNLDYMAMVRHHRQSHKLTNSQIELLLMLKYALGEADYELNDIMQFIVSDKVQDTRSILDIAIHNKYTSIISYIMKANMNDYQYQSIFELKYIPNPVIEKVNKDVSRVILDLFEENINYVSPQHFIPFLSNLSVTSSSGKDIITLLTLNDYTLCINNLLPYLISIDIESMQLNKILNFAKLHEDYAAVQYILQHKLGTKLYAYLSEVSEVWGGDDKVPKLSSKMSVWLLDILESWTDLTKPEKLINCLSYPNVKNNRGHEIIDIVLIGNIGLSRFHQVLNSYLGDDLYEALVSGNLTEKTINSIHFKLAHKLWRIYLGNNELFSLVNFAICIKDFNNFVVYDNRTFLDIVIQQCNFEEIIKIMKYKPEFNVLSAILSDNNIGKFIEFNEYILVCSKTTNNNCTSFLFTRSSIGHNNILIQNTDDADFFNIRAKKLGFRILLKYEKLISANAMKFLLPNDNTLFLDWVQQACDSNNKELIKLLFLAHDDILASAIISGDEALIEQYKNLNYFLDAELVSIFCQRDFLAKEIFKLEDLICFIKSFDIDTVQYDGNPINILENILLSKHCTDDLISKIFTNDNQQQRKLPKNLYSFFAFISKNSKVNLLNTLLDLDLRETIINEQLLKEIIIQYSDNECLDKLFNSTLIDLNKPYFNYNNIIEFAFHNGYNNIIKSIIKADNFNVNMQINDVPLAFFLLNAGYFEILPSLFANHKLNINITNKYSESLLSNLVSLLFGEYIINKFELINIFCNVNNIAMGQGVNDTGLCIKILEALFMHDKLNPNIDIVYYNKAIPIIFYAMYSNNAQLMDLLLKHPMTNIYPLDDLGNDFIFSAFSRDNLELIRQILHSTHFKLYYTNEQGQLLISQYLKQLNQNYLPIILDNIINDLEQDIGFNNIGVVCILFDNLMKITNKEHAQELAIKLLDKTTEINVNQIIISGQHILFELIHYDNQIDLIKSILDKGANFEILDNNGKSLLHYAVDYENFIVLDYLVKYAEEHKINIYDLKLKIANYILQSKIYGTYSYLCTLNLKDKDIDDIIFLRSKTIDGNNDIENMEQETSLSVMNRPFDFNIDPFDQDNMLSNIIDHVNNEFSPF